MHFILAEMCGNLFYEGIARSALKLASYHVTSANLDGKPYHPHTMHKPIIEAVAAGDREAAYSEMQKHISEFGEILRGFNKARLRKHRRTAETQRDR